MGINEFADLSLEQFAQPGRFLGYRHIERPYLRSKNFKDLPDVQPPESIDWRTKGAVTPVKNQGEKHVVILAWFIDLYFAFVAPLMRVHRLFVSLSYRQLWLLLGIQVSVSWSLNFCFFIAC